MNNQEYILKSEVTAILDEMRNDEWRFGEGDEEYAPGFWDALDEAKEKLDNLSGVSGWIDVKERLPEKEGIYFVVLNCDGVISIEDSMFYLEDGFTFPDEMITHWQPIPLPPHP